MHTIGGIKTRGILELATPRLKPKAIQPCKYIKRKIISVLKAIFLNKNYEKEYLVHVKTT